MELTIEFIVRVSIEQLLYVRNTSMGTCLSYEHYKLPPLESIITTFDVVSESRSLEKCPGPDPRSRTVFNFRLISYLALLNVYFHSDSGDDALASAR